MNILKKRLRLNRERKTTGKTPILSRIKNKVLRMKGYQISQGVAQAMGESFRLYSDGIEKLYMESNGTDDKTLSFIL